MMTGGWLLERSWLPAKELRKSLSGPHFTNPIGPAPPVTAPHRSSFQLWTIWSICMLSRVSLQPFQVAALPSRPSRTLSPFRLWPHPYPRAPPPADWPPPREAVPVRIRAAAGADKTAAGAGPQRCLRAAATAPAASTPAPLPGLRPHPLRRLSPGRPGGHRTPIAARTPTRRRVRGARFGTRR